MMINTKRQVGGFLVLGSLLAPACYVEGPPTEPAEREGTVSQAITAACTDPSTATILGTEGDDYLIGTEGADIIFGLGGNDTILGLGDDDILCGGPGNDIIQGGDGNDAIGGDAGNDSIQGGDGDDEIDGGADYNWLHGNGGDDVIRGGDNGNELQGGAGNDTLLGGAGYDWMLGDDGNDIMDGGAGNDDMEGGAGDDCMDGGAGNDKIFGEEGNDCVSGGDDTDQVVCGGGNDTYSEGEWDFGGCETAGACNCTSYVNETTCAFAGDNQGRDDAGFSGQTFVYHNTSYGTDRFMWDGVNKGEVPIGTNSVTDAAGNVFTIGTEVSHPYGNLWYYEICRTPALIAPKCAFAGDNQGRDDPGFSEQTFVYHNTSYGTDRFMWDGVNKGEAPIGTNSVTDAAGNVFTLGIEVSHPYGNLWYYEICVNQ